MPPTSPTPWLLTTPSSAHIAIHLSSFRTYTAFPSLLGNPYTPSTNLRVHGVGTVHLAVRTSPTTGTEKEKEEEDEEDYQILELTNVLYIPSGLPVNIISMALLHREGWVQNVPKGLDGRGRGVLRKEGRRGLMLRTNGRTRLRVRGAGDGDGMEGEVERKVVRGVEFCWTGAERGRWERYRRNIADRGGDEGRAVPGDGEDNDADEGLNDIEAAEQTPPTARPHPPFNTNNNDNNSLPPSLSLPEHDWLDLHFDGLENFFASLSLSTSIASELTSGILTLRKQMKELSAAMAEEESEAPATVGEVEHADGVDGTTMQSGGGEMEVMAGDCGVSADTVTDPADDGGDVEQEPITDDELAWMRLNYGGGTTFFAVHGLEAEDWVEAVGILRGKMAGGS